MIPKHLLDELRARCTLVSGREVECLINEIEGLQEYAKATSYWKIEPHDQKEREAYFKRLDIQ